MLRKLLKYDLKALFPWYGIAFGILLILSLLVRLSLGSTIGLADTEVASDATVLATLFSTMSTTLSCMGFFLVLVAVSLLTTYLPAWKFYTSCLKDEGYLTFTLPTTPIQIYNSKMISAVLGQYACGLVTIGAVAIAFLTLDWRGMVGADIWDMMGNELGFLWAEIATPSMIATIVIYILLALLTPFHAMGIIFVSFAIGQLANKNRFLWSVVAYIAISTVQSTVSEVANLILSLCTLSLDTTTEDVLLVQLLTAILALVITSLFTAASIIASRIILKKHLNLE